MIGSQDWQLLRAQARGFPYSCEDEVNELHLIKDMHKQRAPHSSAGMSAQDELTKPSRKDTEGDTY
jgi:hypothetical protein